MCAALSAIPLGSSHASLEPPHNGLTLMDAKTLQQPTAEEPPAAEEAAAPAEEDVDTNDVHALAAVATKFEADVEKFLDDALIADVTSTPLTTLDDVLAERQDRQQREERLKSRRGEFLEEELAKQRHEREVKELEEAVAVTQQPMPGAPLPIGANGQRSRRASAGPGAEKGNAVAAAAAEVEAARRELEAVEANVAPPFKLESASRKTDAQNPYVLNLTDFLPEVQSTRQARELRAENDILRKCLGDNARQPKAFEAYLKRNAQPI